jgi:6-phosphogluconolactonase/glucosamine-6-phosphate isomerase/deaminase
MIEHVMKNDDEISAYIADQITELVKRKPDAVLCLAAGTSSLGVFSELLKRSKAGKISFARAKFIAMDEWTGMGACEEGSMGDFLTRNFLAEAGFSEVFLFDGKAKDPESECRRAENFIKANGGIDYIVFGLGLSGHVALNEPGTEKTARAHLAKLNPITAEAGKKYFSSTVPELTGGITLGIADALEAKKVVLVVNSGEKRGITKRFIEAQPSSALPAAFLKEKEGFEFFVTEEVV